MYLILIGIHSFVPRVHHNTNSDGGVAKIHTIIEILLVMVLILVYCSPLLGQVPCYTCFVQFYNVVNDSVFVMILWLRNIFFVIYSLLFYVIILQSYTFSLKYTFIAHFFKEG